MDVAHAEQGREADPSGYVEAALMGVDEIEFTGTVGNLIPVAENRVPAVPEGVSGVRIAMDEALRGGDP